MKETIQSGAKIYSKPVLFFYDFIVLKLSNSFAWKCPSKNLLALYNQHVSANHLDIGVGTGYFLDRCSYPSRPRIALLDLNPNTLEVSARRISRYRPEKYEADITRELPLNLPHFDSIGINYLLHCLPGVMPEKEAVFKNAKSLLNKNGVVFGATILGHATQGNFLARKLIEIYNAKKIMSNSKDTIGDLEALLARNFKEYRVWQQGHVALFSARI